MSTKKISNLPPLTTLTSDKRNTIIVGVNLETSDTSRISLDTLANQLYLTNSLVVGPNVYIGSSTSANTFRFPNAVAVIAKTTGSIQKNEPHNIGLIAEGTAHPTISTIYGIGVYGVGYTNAATRSGGVVGEGHVSAAADGGSAIGVRGYANDTHTGGHNIGLYGEASGASGSGSNYALYMNTGNVYSAIPQTWTLSPNLTFTGPAGATIINSNTNLLASGNSNIFISGSGSLGYTTGAGGVVTQNTSKSTTVLLNKSCGQITSNAASLAAATTVSFTFTNNTIAIGDVLILNHVSGGTVGSYLLNAQAAAGSATINIRNVTAGALAEAITISYVVINGSTS